MVSYWHPIPNEGRRPGLPWGVVKYLNTRTCVDALGTAVNSLPTVAWKCISETIHAGPTISKELAGLVPNNQDDILAESLTAAWTVLLQSPPWRKLHIDLLTLETVLEAVSQNTLPSITPSVRAIAKTVYCQALDWQCGAGTPEDLIAQAHRPIPPAFAPFLGPSDHVPEDVREGTDKLRSALRLRCIEGRMDTLTEFVECCCAADLPLKAADTLEYTGNFLPESAVHPTHQLRFATAVKKLFNTIDCDGREVVLHQLLSLQLFKVYAPTHLLRWSPGTPYAWLDNAEARDILKAAFSTYLPQLSSKTNHRILVVVQEMLTQLDDLHSEHVNGAQGVSRAHK